MTENGEQVKQRYLIRINQLFGDRKCWLKDKKDKAGRANRGDFRSVIIPDTVPNE